MLNRGLEIELGWRDSIGDLSYSISGNFSTLKNEVTYLDPAIYRLENGSQFYNNRARTAFEVGYPIWYMRGYKLEGIDQETGKPIFYDANGDGNIEDGDRTFIGKGIPDYTFGLTVSLEWKGFDFNLYGAGVGGNQIMNLYYQADGPMRNSLRYFYDNAWTETNKTAKVPSCISVVNDWTYWSSSGVIFDGGYFKIKQIQLGYTLPEKLLKKIFIKGVRAYVSFDDFFCFTKNYPGFDPETATTGSANGMGLDLGSYPTTRKIVAGINIKF